MSELDPTILKKFLRGFDAPLKDESRPIPTIKPNCDFSEEAAENLARFLHNDICGLGISMLPIINVLTRLNNEQRLVVQEKYKELFNRNLTEDLKEDLLGDFETIVLFLMTPRNEFDAQCIRRALFPNEAEGEEYKESWLLEILCARTKEDIIKLIEVYNEKYNSQLSNDISAKTQEKPLLQKALLALCDAEREKTKFMDVDLSLAESDAESIYKSTEGQEGTDVDALITIFTKRSWAHLREVFSIYKEQRGKTPEESIDKDLQGDVKSAFLFLAKFARNPYEYFADRIKDALNGEVDDDESVYRLLIARSELDLQNIRISFKRKYKKTMVKLIKEEFYGDVQKMLMKILDPLIIF